MAYKTPGIADKGTVVVAVLWAENVLTYIVVGLRLYTRRFVRGSLGWDDLCLAIVALLMTLFAALTTVAAVHGMGQHVYDLEDAQFSKAMFFLLCAQFVVSLAIGMGKVSVAVFLLRIVTVSWHRWFLWFCIASMMALSVFLSISVFAQCTPVESIWNPVLADERICHISLVVVAFIDCAYAAIMDFVLAAFPWFALRGLKMKRKDRIVICSSLSLGIFAGICGIIRTAGLNALTNSTDYLYATADSVMLTATEVTTTIVCIALPALRPLYNKIRGQESSMADYQQHDDSAYGTGPSYNLSSYPGTRGEDGLTQNNNFASAKASLSKTKANNHSDETILLPGDGKSIMRVHEVSVSYETAHSDHQVPTTPSV